MTHGNKLFTKKYLGCYAEVLKEKINESTGTCIYQRYYCMTSLQSVQQHPASVDAYIRHGWSLVPIPPNTKGPRTTGWNKQENALKSMGDLPAGYGIGLAHAYSGTMAFDIDEWGTTSMLLGLQGIDLQALYDAPDAVVIDSGKSGHGKLLYSMPVGLSLPSKKIMAGGVTAYELRCATANGLTVQDVMPPSIHPETRQAYRWAGKGHWMRLPPIPQALLDVWQKMLSQEQTRSINTGEHVNSSWGEIRSALESVTPNCPREEWINCGMALHWAGTQTGQLDDALHLWNEWSRPSDKYPGDRAVMSQWLSFKSDKDTAVKLGTLFHLARKAGWSRPMPDAASLFSSVTATATAPTTIVKGLRPVPPNMDMDVWPSVLATRAQEVSESVGCDPLVPLFAGLSAICGVIDAQTRLELMPGYQVPPVLWLMTLGAPADKKTPGSKPMLSPLKFLEAEDRPRFGKEMLDWEGKEAAFASAKKSFLEFSASPEAMLSGDQAPSVPDMPDQPVALKITVNDITSQKLVREASSRPRGLLCHLDEMNSWIKKLTDKSSGEDRSAWVVSYESDSYIMDRVGAGSIFCENLAISIYGNIQPRVFRDNMAALSADGLLQRFIPAILRDDKTRLGNPVPEYLTTAAAWENTLRMVYAVPAQTYKLSPEAYVVFRAFQSWYEDAKHDERLLHSGDTFMTAFGKLEGTAGRLILLFHVTDSPFTTLVPADVVHRVIRFVKSYLIPAYRYAFNEVSGTSNFDQWVTDYIIHYCDHDHITMSEIKRGARRQIDGISPWQADQMVLGAMQMLEVSGWVMRMDDGTRETQHFAQWAINPALVTQFKDYRERVIKAKQRQLDDIYKLSTKEKPRVYGADNYE